MASADTDGNGRDDFVVAAPEQAPQDRRADVSVFGSVRDCAAQPQSWHEYNFDATGVRAVPGEAVTISPGLLQPQRGPAAPGARSRALDG